MPNTLVNGIGRYSEEVDPGPLLLRIAGLGGDAQEWSMLARVLAERFRVIACDPRGAERSSAPKEPYTILEMAREASALLEHLGIDRSHVAKEGYKRR